MELIDRMRPVRSLACLPLLLALAACGSGGDSGKKPRPPALVGATAAATADFAPRLVALGTVAPLQSVAVRSRVDGQIDRILFREGDNVRAGQPLFQLDDRVARAALAQARATLASVRAAAVQARGDYDRAAALVTKGFISAAVVQQRKALADSAVAAISGAAAAVQSAEATLSFLTIRAPVSGRTGELGFQLGATVRVGDTLPLITVNQLSPIAVRFLVPPDQIQLVRAALARGGLAVVARPQNQPHAAPIASGRLAFLDNNVDPGNGAVAAKAQFTNADARLWPGGIVDVEVPLGTVTRHVALPEAAVQTGRDAPFVWTIGADGKVAMRDVAIAGRADGRVYLASGVAPGETIVTDALSKLRAGDKVRTKSSDGGPGRAPRAAAATPAVAMPAAAGG